MDSAKTGPLLAVLDVFELHGVEAPHLVRLLEVQLAALFVALVEILSVSVCVVVLKAAPPPLDWCLRALVRSMAALGDYHEAKLPPLTSVSGKVGSWEVMAPLSPLATRLTKAAPLPQMPSVRLAPINSQDVGANRLETSIGPNVNWTPLVLYNVLQSAHSNRLNHHNKPIAYHSAADPHPFAGKAGPASSIYPPLA